MSMKNIGKDNHKADKSNGGLTPLGRGILFTAVGLTLVLGARCAMDKQKPITDVISQPPGIHQSAERSSASEVRAQERVQQISALAVDRAKLEKVFPNAGGLIRQAYRLGVLGPVYDTDLVGALLDAQKMPAGPQKNQALDAVRDDLAYRITWARIRVGEMESPGMSFGNAFPGAGPFAASPTIRIDHLNGQRQVATIDGQQVELREANTPWINSDRQAWCVLHVTFVDSEGKAYANNVNKVVPAGGKLDQRFTNFPPVPVFNQATNNPDCVGELITVIVTAVPANDLISLVDPEPTVFQSVFNLFPGNKTGPGRVNDEVPSNYVWQNIPPADMDAANPNGHTIDRLTFYDTDK